MFFFFIIFLKHQPNDKYFIYSSPLDLFNVISLIGKFELIVYSKVL